MSKHTVDILAQMTVTPSGELQAPSDEQLAEALAKVGTYAIVPFHQVDGKPRKTPDKRMFHLGDLPGLSLDDFNALATRGFRTSDQALAAGIGGLLRVGLENDLVDRLVAAFGRLGLEIPTRTGSVPPSPRQHAVKSIMDEFTAYQKVWATKKAFEQKVSLDVLSSFTLQEGKAQVVCGRCGKQVLDTLVAALPSTMCHHCGNELGVDWEKHPANKANQSN